MSRLYVVATGLHQGGGKTVLEAYLAQNTFDKYISVTLYLDSRLNISVADRFSVKIIEPGFINYWKLERELRRSVTKDDEVFCINGRPLMARLQAHVKILLQNRLLLVWSSLAGYGTWPRLRMNLERFWMSLFLKNVNEILVQSPTMKKLVEARWPSLQTKVSHYYKSPTRDLSISPIREFIYVSSGEPHKNHDNLFKALEILDRRGVSPRVATTLSPADFQAKTAPYENLKIENLHGLSWDEIVREYQKSQALIFPSLIESLGLPLVEARELQLKILASDRDFVFDVCEPDQTFDPTEPKDIARAIQDFLT